MATTLQIQSYKRRHYRVTFILVGVNRALARKHLHNGSGGGM